jgi:hypothetical protein
MPLTTPDYALLRLEYVLYFADDVSSAQRIHQRDRPYNKLPLYRIVGSLIALRISEHSLSIRDPGEHKLHL